MRERMMEREGSKPNAVVAPHALVALQSSAKSATGKEATTR
jgi:hypothetical protein